MLVGIELIFRNVQKLKRSRVALSTPLSALTRENVLITQGTKARGRRKPPYPRNESVAEERTTKVYPPTTPPLSVRVKPASK